MRKAYFFCPNATALLYPIPSKKTIEERKGKQKQVPQILRGASSSRRLGCWRKISLETVQSWRISFSVSWTCCCLAALVCLKSNKRLIISSKTAEWMEVCGRWAIESDLNLSQREESEGKEIEENDGTKTNGVGLLKFTFFFFFFSSWFWNELVVETAIASVVSVYLVGN